MAGANLYIIQNSLENYPLFRKTFLSCSTEREFRKGSVIRKTEEMFPGFYMLLSGMVEVGNLDESGHRKIIFVYCDQMMIGASCMTRHKSEVDYRCMTHVRMAYCPKHQIHNWTNQMLLEFAKIQTDKMRLASSQMQFSGTHSTKEKLLRLLWEYRGIQEQEVLQPGIYMGKMQREIMTGFLGISEVRFSGLLNELAAEAYITYDRQTKEIGITEKGRQKTEGESLGEIVLST